MKDELLKLTDVDGKELTYKILATFINNNKNYIIYGDDEGKAYASIFDPYDETVFEDLTTDEEWDMVNQVLEELQGDENG